MLFLSFTAQTNMQPAVICRYGLTMVSAIALSIPFLTDGAFHYTSELKFSEFMTLRHDQKRPLKSEFQVGKS